MEKRKVIKTREKTTKCPFCEQEISYGLEKERCEHYIKSYPRIGLDGSKPIGYGWVFHEGREKRSFK